MASFEEKIARGRRRGWKNDHQCHARKNVIIHCVISEKPGFQQLATQFPTQGAAKSKALLIEMFPDEGLQSRSGLTARGGARVCWQTPLNLRLGCEVPAQDECDSRYSAEKEDGDEYGQNFNHRSIQNLKCTILYMMIFPIANDPSPKNSAGMTIG